jgi:hypothetical protein
MGRRNNELSEQWYAPNSGALERLAVPSLHVTPVVLMLNDTNIIRYGNRVGHMASRHIQIT